MKFKLVIDMDNAAFGDGSPTTAAIEVERILARAAAEFRNGNAAGQLRDTNGNTVGEWVIAP